MTERTRYREVTNAFTAVVTDIERVGATHVRVVVDGAPGLALLDTVAVDVGDGALRRYTVSRVIDDGFEFVTFRTGRGPATAWLDAVQVGDTVTGLAPERPVKTPPADVQAVVVAGDDTAVGVARAVGASHAGRLAVGIVGAVLAEDVARLTGADVTVVDTDEQLVQWVGARATGTGTHVLLVGEQALNQQLRQHAFGLGVTKDALDTRTFWRPDKAGIE